MSATVLLPTTVVGSYPQPDWLIDRESLGKGVPRVRARELWRVAEPWLEQAQDDATIVAIHDMERAGLEIISDGEIRRESYSNRFANSVAGVEPDRLGTGLTRFGRPAIVPYVSGPIRREGPVELRNLLFLKEHTDRKIKITLPGPFTMTHQAENAYYPDEESLAMDFAAAVNEEIKDLFGADADVVQIDEPFMQAYPDKARDYGIKTLNRALDGARGTTAVHLCFGYGHLVKDKPSSYSFLAELENSRIDQVSIEAAQPKLDLSILNSLPSKIIILGVLDLADESVETPALVAERIRAALKIVPPDRLVVAPDCGMKYLPRAVAFAKLKALVEGARLIRAELSPL